MTHPPDSDAKMRELRLKPSAWCLRLKTLVVNNLSPRQQEEFQHDLVYLVERDAYEKLKAENEGLKADIEMEYSKGVAINTSIITERDQLKAEVERLKQEVKNVKADYMETHEEYMDVLKDKASNDKDYLELSAELASLRFMVISTTQILKKVLNHLDNPATSQNEALCLIRRDVEDALQTKDT